MDLIDIPYIGPIVTKYGLEVIGLTLIALGWIFQTLETRFNWDNTLTKKFILTFCLGVGVIAYAAYERNNMVVAGLSILCFILAAINLVNLVKLERQSKNKEEESGIKSIF